MFIGQFEYFNFKLRSYRIKIIFNNTFCSDCACYAKPTFKEKVPRFKFKQ